MDPFADEPDEEEDEYEDWSPFPMKIYAYSSQVIGGYSKIRLLSGKKLRK